MLDDEKLVELLVKRDDLLEQGKDSSPEEVCEDCPELADEFRDRLANLKASDWMFQSDDGQEGDGTWELPVPAALPPPDPPLPASSLTISEFRQSVTRSGLMTAEEMDLIQRSVPTDVSADTQSFARELVQRKKLTPYQAAVLLSERSDPLLLDR